MPSPTPSPAPTPSCSSCFAGRSGRVLIAAAVACGCAALAVWTAYAAAAGDGAALAGRLVRRESAAVEKAPWGSLRRYARAGGGPSAGAPLASAVEIEPGQTFALGERPGRERVVIVTAGSGTGRLGGESAPARKGDVLAVGPRGGLAVSSGGESVLGLVIVERAIGRAAAAAGAAPRVLFEDPFAGKLASGWRTIRETPVGWRVRDGELRIRVLPGNLWGPPNDARNLIVRELPPVPARGLAVEVAVASQPSEQYEQAGLAWYVDDANMVKLVKEQVDGRPWVVMGREIDDHTRTVAKVALPAPRVSLRLIFRDGRLRGEYRLPIPGRDERWIEAGSCAFPVKGPARVILHAYNGPRTSEHWARFRAFRITEAPE